MTRQRDFKAAVRDRMKKTGEAYTTARSQLLGRRRDAESPRFDPSEFPGLLPGYDQFGGLQGDVAALEHVLRHAGVRDAATGEPLDETWLAGICGGIGFMYFVFEYEGHAPMLTITARSASMPDAFIDQGLERLGLAGTRSETGSARVAARALEDALEAESAALCVVDVASIDYYGLPAEWAGWGPHVVAVAGRDEDGALWIDDRSMRPMKIEAAAFARARSAYRKAKHRLVAIDRDPEPIDVAEIACAAVAATARGFHEAPVKGFARNFGLAGIEKLRDLITDTKDKKGWPRLFAKADAFYAGLRRVYECIECEGTTTAASRPLYADFLDRLAKRADRPGLAEAANGFRASGTCFSRIAERIRTCGDDAIERGCAIASHFGEWLDEGALDPKVARARVAEKAALGRSCGLDSTTAADLLAAIACDVGEILEIERAAVERLGAAV